MALTSLAAPMINKSTNQIKINNKDACTFNITELYYTAVPIYSEGHISYSVSFTASAPAKTTNKPVKSTKCNYSWNSTDLDTVEYQIKQVKCKNVDYTFNISQTGQAYQSTVVDIAVQHYNGQNNNNKKQYDNSHLTYHSVQGIDGNVQCMEAYFPNAIGLICTTVPAKVSSEVSKKKAAKVIKS